MWRARNVSRMVCGRRGPVLAAKRPNSGLVPKPDNAVKKNASSPPPLDIAPDVLVQRRGEFVPKLRPRVAFDHSAPPRPSESQKPPGYRGYVFKRVLPSLVLLGSGIWVLYTYDFFTTKEEDTVVLHPELFTKWIITYRYELPGCPDHYILELTKRNFKKLQSSSVDQSTPSMWDGHKLWSVEICQPEINIVRSYTPLPLYVAAVDPTTKAPFLKVIDKKDEEGKLVLYIKKYDQGEMARWLAKKPLYSEVLLRGPFEDFKLPFSPVVELPERETLKNVPSQIQAESRIKGHVKPDNIAFYVAGTGITPALQMLYSRNPPRGVVDVHWSLNDRKEILKGFDDLNLFLEKLGRARFHYYVASEGKYVSKDDIRAPAEKNYHGFKSDEYVVSRQREKKIEEITQDPSLSAAQKLELIASVSEDPNDKYYDPANYKNQLDQFAAIKDKLVSKDPALAIVCGPDGYLNYVCGPKDINNAENKDLGPIKGLLAGKGWSRDNTVRL